MKEKQGNGASGHGNEEKGDGHAAPREKEGGSSLPGVLIPIPER